MRMDRASHPAGLWNSTSVVERSSSPSTGSSAISAVCFLCAASEGSARGITPNAFSRRESVVVVPPVLREGLGVLVD